MPQPATEKVRQEWKDKILMQGQSGLSIANWCRQNKLSVHVFRYWRDKIFPKHPLDRSAFKEITKEQQTIIPKQATGICIEYERICIHVDREFDILTLKKCLKALKEVSC